MISDQTEKESVASTAYWIAAVLAHETERIDRLFDDPWAALLAGQAGQDWLDRIATIQTQADRMNTDYRISLHWSKPRQEWGRPALRFEMALPKKFADALGRAVPEKNSCCVLVHQEEAPIELGIVIRTKFFDDFLLRATQEHEIRQVVILASGMDTRAFRLTWPAHTRLFEIDQSELLLQKRQILASVGASVTCWHRSIGADLVEGPWSATLMRTGFDPHQKSVWLIEGLLPFLSESAVLALLDKVAALSAPGSCLGLNAVNRNMLTSPMIQFWLKSMEEAGVPWLSAIDDPEAFLAERGWVATVVQFGEEGANFGRWPYPVIPRSVPNFPRSWLVTAVKRSSGKS